MSKKGDFVCLVQTAAIVESLIRGNEKYIKASGNAAIAVHCAMQVNERDIPDELTEACKGLIDYVYDEDKKIPKPGWLIGVL